jgi:hypothetical protein
MIPGCLILSSSGDFFKKRILPMACKTDDCDKIYVSWTWATALLVGSVITICGLAWAGGSKIAITDKRLEDVEVRVTKIENINNDLDTIKAILRTAKP